MARSHPILTAPLWVGRRHSRRCPHFKVPHLYDSSAWEEHLPRVTQLITDVETQPQVPHPSALGSFQLSLKFLTGTPDVQVPSCSPPKPWAVFTFGGGPSPVFIHEEPRGNDNAISARHRSLGQGWGGAESSSHSAFSWAGHLGSGPCLSSGSGIIF